VRATWDKARSFMKGERGSAAMASKTASRSIGNAGRGSASSGLEDVAAVIVRGHHQAAAFSTVDGPPRFYYPRPAEAVRREALRWSASVSRQAVDAIRARNYERAYALLDSLPEKAERAEAAVSSPE
jgi:hypothetical protein